VTKDTIADEPNRSFARPQPLGAEASPSSGHFDWRNYRQYRGAVS